MNEIKFILSVENYDKALNLLHVLNYLNKNHNEEATMDELAKAAFVYYIDRFYESSKAETNKSQLMCLGDPNYPLKFRFESYIQERGLPIANIAKQLKMSIGGLKSIIENKNQPSIDNFMRLWVFLGCPPLHEIMYRDIED